MKLLCTTWATLALLLGDVQSYPATKMTGLVRQCNGYAELCDRGYSNITWVGTHNAPFHGTGPADNQYLPFDGQLEDGIRFLTIRTRGKGHRHMKSCHGKCLFKDAGRLQKYLKQTRKFLEAHPDEVVTLLITNPDHQDISRFEGDFVESGLDRLAYAGRGDGSKLAKDQWPTLGELINMDKRAIVFMGLWQSTGLSWIDANPVAAYSHMDTERVPYIHSEFDHFWETEFGETDEAFPQCSVHRPSGGDTNRLMGIMNHFLDKLWDLVGGFVDVMVPDREKAPITNGQKSIMDQVDKCQSQHGTQPNVILLDYVERGTIHCPFALLNSLESECTEPGE